MAAGGAAVSRATRAPSVWPARFRWPFRRYQALALEAYEEIAAGGGRRFYLVMPPGAGKTVAGLEIARRQARRTLVLCPNTAVQAQWLSQWRDFEPGTLPATPDRMLPTALTALTYQSLCNLHRGPALDERARALWAEALRREGASPAEVAAQLGGGAGSTQHRTELARYRRHARRLTVEGGDREELLTLLHPNGRALIERMKATGPWTLVLDECHHLLEMWGHLVRAVAEELGEPTFVLGLTATPPAELSPRQAELYRALFGRADFEVPTPAVVKEGELAAYQELACLTRPLPHEADYLAAQHERFEVLLDRLLEPGFGSRPFLEWVRLRTAERRVRGGAQVSWARFARDRPRLADAALRLHHRLALPPPRDARPGERHRAPLSADDWVALIEDYCMHCLRGSADPGDEAAWEAVRAALPALGYVLTRQGIRSHRSPVDRVLALSASKSIAALRILESERESLGAHLRALLLCDHEQAAADGVQRLRGVLDARAGSAALLLHTLTADRDARELHPILVTGRTVACARSTALDLSQWMAREVPELADALAMERAAAAAGAHAEWEDVVALRPRHRWWRPRHYVPLVTRYVEAGHSRCLIGTRALLGEGWDARRINVLIDLTTASTRTAVHQMRGRSLRLDPELPRKVANNWDVVCIDPDHPKGDFDYARFVRKHEHYFAPTPDGEIESGVSHVDPALSPYGPPPAAVLDALNARMLERARDRERAWALWRIGEPYESREIHTTRVRFGRTVALPAQRLLRRADAARGEARTRARIAGVAATAAAIGAGGAVLASGVIGAGAGLAIAAGGSAWLLHGLRSAVGRLVPSDALEDLAAATAEGLARTGGIDRGLGAGSVRVTAQSDGYYRCYLAGADEASSRRFAEAMEELLAPLVAPRYIIPRFVAEPPRSLADAAALALRLWWRRHGGARVVYHAVPSYLAANRARVNAFHQAWNRHVSAGTPLFWRDPRAQGILHVQEGEDLFAAATQMRTLWR
jgi:superfamily II DNA or RNA helicase